MNNARVAISRNGILSNVDGIGSKYYVIQNAHGTVVHYSFLLKFKSKNAEQETKNKFELSLESHTSEHYSM
jgi:hypothetical protein